MKDQIKTKIHHLVSCSISILLFFLTYSALASPPVLYKLALYHHADGHYHFNRLTDDTLGPNDLKVLTILFLPSGVTPGAGASSRAITLAQEVQNFFQTEMAARGYGAKTFDLVKDSGGNVVVVTINGTDSLAGYSSSSDQAFDKLKQELSGQANLANYPHQKFIYFVVFEGLDAFGEAGGVGGQFGPSGGMALIPRGAGDTDALNFDMNTIAHELGHAFGLDHDFRSGGNFAPPAGKHYVMSYDSADATDYVLSDCNADYLAVDRYFNRQSYNGQLVEDTSPEIKVNTALAYASGTTSHQVEFELSDPDSLHQVQFSVITDVPVGDPHEVANDSPQIEICQLLSSVSTATKSYNYGTHLAAVSGSKSSTARARRIHVKVVDNRGQESYKSFAIYDQDRPSVTHTLSAGGSLQNLLEQAWPKDMISISGTPVDTGSLFIESGALTLTSADPTSPQQIAAILIIDGAEETQLRSLRLSGVSLQSFATNVVIDSCMIQSTDIAGVYIDGKSSATLIGNTIQNCSQWGIYAKTGSMVTVGGSIAQESNTVRNNDIGIQLEGVGTVGQPVLVIGNTIQNNAQDGIVASLGTVVTIGGTASGQANSIMNNGTGISLFDTNTYATYAKIVNNTIQGNQGTAGIYIDGGQADIIGNTVQSNLNWGIYGKPGAQLTIGGAMPAERNVVQSNKIGIQLEGVGTIQQPTSIAGNTINQNADDGIALAAGSVVMVGGQSTSRGNIISDNAQVGLSIYGSNTNVTVQNNTIHKSGSSGVFIQGEVSAVSLNANLITSNNLQGVYIQNNTTLAQITVQKNLISDNQGAVYSTSPTTEIVFLNNLIYRNNKGDRGLQLSGDATFINNTITGHSGDALLSFGNDKTIKVYNTIFANNTNDWYVEGSYIVTHSLFDGSLPFGVTGNNNIAGDPQFVDATNDDYQLQATSPAIDAGDKTVTSLPDQDLVGNPRIFNDQVDIGGYEYGSSPTPAHVPIHLSPGWNMISIPGHPLETDPATLQTADISLILPLYRWNPTTFSYEAVTELKFAEGYWALTINPEGTTLQIAVNSANSYDRTLQPGWNMIGGVSQAADFSNPDDNPDKSIIPGTLYSWNPTNFSYEAQTEILPNKGYWVLTLAECQLTVGGDTAIPTAPQKLPQPEVMISLNLSCEEWHRKLEIGMDQLATEGLEAMDRALPPVGPQDQGYQAHLVGRQYRLQRDSRPITDQTVSWQMRLSSPEPVQLTIDSQGIPAGQELIIIDGQMETVVTAGMEMHLDSGDREVTVSLRPLAKVMQLLQNYPNPFNPETWIPYQLNQASEVSLSIYSSDGILVRQIDLGLRPTGNYQTTERAAHWDGRNAVGESVSSGVYFYQIEAGDYRQMRKMMMLK